MLAFVLSFPLNVYEHFFREHQYGLATQSFPAWFREQLIGLGITLIGGTIFFIVLYAVFRRAPKTWWIWGTGVAVVFSFVLVFIAPVFIEPLFNTYKPLTKPEISEPILAMARANEIPVKQVFEVDASRQTTRVSANVSGFLGTTRIALNDNLLKQCTVPEIRAVMAHEMGHYVLNHGAKLLTYLGIFVLIGFALTRILFDAAVRRWGDKWGVRGIADPAGLPLLALIFSTLLFLATPLLNTVVRVTEREADAFGINTAREPDGMAEVALKLGAYRKLNPTPLEEFIFYDHPSGRARIRMAMDWKAANLSAGESPKSESQNPKTNRGMIPSTHLAGMLRRRGSSGSRAALSDQHQIANVDQRVGKIGEDADRIALEDEIKAHDHAAGDAPIPKRDRDHAFALPL